jgi:hypothetical protein
MLAPLCIYQNILPTKSYQKLLKPFANPFRRQNHSYLRFHHATIADNLNK